MSEAGLPAPPASTALEKAPAGKKAKKPVKAASAAPKKKPVGPSVSELIMQAVSSSKERSGMSLAALKKALSAAGYDVEKNNSRIKLGLKSLVSKGTLVQTKGMGASGSFKLNKKAAEAKPSTTKAVAKTKVAFASKKPRKSTGAAAKKGVKTPKKAMKPVAARKPSKSPKKPKVLKAKKVPKSPVKAKAVKPKGAKVKVTKPKTAKPKKTAPKKSKTSTKQTALLRATYTSKKRALHKSPSSQL